jgi:hypothetical protein
VVRADGYTVTLADRVPTDVAELERLDPDVILLNYVVDGQPQGGRGLCVQRRSVWLVDTAVAGVPHALSLSAGLPRGPASRRAILMFFLLRHDHIEALR